MPNNSRKEIALWDVSVLYSGGPTSSLGRWMRNAQALLGEQSWSNYAAGWDSCVLNIVCLLFLVSKIGPGTLSERFLATRVLSLGWCKVSNENQS